MVAGADSGEAADLVVECGAPGCTSPGTKKCSRCGKEAYCSADCQRKAWSSHKLVCQSANTAESELRECMRQGKLYSARRKLPECGKLSAKLSEEIEDLVAMGVHSEIIDGALRCESVGDMGKGYVAARALTAGEALLFDTSFLFAPCDGSQAPHFLMAEKLAKRLAGGARRRSAKADTQADFFYNTVRALPLKGNMDRSSVESAKLDDDMREQMLICSIVEGSALYCSEELNYMALFPAAAYFNHSCVPNARVESSRSTLIVRASEDIDAGQEVLISYLPPALLEEPVAKRHARLDGGRGFACGCSRCRAEWEASGGPPSSALGAPIMLEPGSKPTILRKDGGPAPSAPRDLKGRGLQASLKCVSVISQWPTCVLQQRIGLGSEVGGEASRGQQPKVRSGEMPL